MRFLLVFGAFVFSACDSKTQTQVFVELRPTADVLRTKVVAAAKAVEKRPYVDPDSKCKAPKTLTPVGPTLTRVGPMAFPSVEAAAFGEPVMKRIVPSTNVAAPAPSAMDEIVAD